MSNSRTRPLLLRRIPPRQTSRPKVFTNIKSITLPFDVLHTVIEMLATDEPPAFKVMRSVSQTCRYLLPVCRKHIFAAIWLKSRIYGADVDNMAHARARKPEARLHIGATNLAKLVASSPEIAGYVRELVFCPHFSNWNDETLLSLLQKFERVEKLHIRHQRSDMELLSRFKSWESLDGSLQIAMVNLIHQQRDTLTHLYFTDYLNIPTSIIYPLTCLHTFQLFDSTMSLAIKADPTGVCHLRPLRLESLAFTVGYSTISVLLEGMRPGIGVPFFDLSQLRVFSAMTRSTETVDEGISIRRLLQGMGKLKSLDISVQQHSIPPDFLQIFNAIHPDASATLEVLRFQVRYTVMGAGPTHHQLPGAILRHTRTFPALKQLRISVYIVLPVVDHTPVTEDLKALDHVLATQEFSGLKFLQLFIFFSGASGAHDFMWLVDFSRFMPRSSRNPALKFEHKLHSI